MIGGCLFGGPHNKDYTNLGSTYGVSVFQGNYQIDLGLGLLTSPTLREVGLGSSYVLGFRVKGLGLPKPR